jgi:hypothetical protein
MLKDLAWAAVFGLFIGVLMILVGSELPFAVGIGVLGAVVRFISGAFGRWRKSRATLE